MTRGELRIYMGAAPGVGKTFAMLNEGRRRRDRGSDVVIGYVETHGRPNTEAQLGDLEVIPRHQIVHRGQAFDEMDLDAIIERRPELVLVDELAHTNVPGSRNEKRWQDVEELLTNGISVISTVNVQHLESLNDVIAQITGVVQRETIPDVIVRHADQVELVDMTPEALQRRMAHGNIYAADKVDAALANYFRAGNLGALRELALLWVADRVDEEIESYRQRHGITVPWATRERIVVALTGAPGSERLLRRGARLAARGGGELVGVHIHSTDGLATHDQARLEAYRELLEELGGRYAEASGDDIAQALVDFTRAENGTQILLGSSRRSRWAELTRGSVINKVVDLVDGIDVHVIAPDRTAMASDRTAMTDSPVVANDSIAATRRLRSVHRPARQRALAWAVALVITPALGVLLVPSEAHVGIAATLLVLLLGPIAAALAGGLRPALVASVMAFVALDVLYIRPSLSLRVADPSDLMTLAAFLLVAGVVSALVDRLARRTSEATMERTEADALARLANSTAILDGDSLDRLVGELRSTLGLDSVAVLLRTVDSWTPEASVGEPVPASPAEGSYSAELAEGATLVAVGPTLPAADRRLLSAFVSQVRLARSTLSLQEEATRAEALAESNDLRQAVLSAVSHDLRAPLANIKAAATSLMSTDVCWSDEQVGAFAQTIDEEVDRLTALVVNMLDMSRLQVGMLGPRFEACALGDVVYSALVSQSGDVSMVDVAVPEDMEFVWTDPVLLERVLVNVIRNAMDWAPTGTTVRVDAAEIDGSVELRVIDRGSGIPRRAKEGIFEPFQRLGDGGNAAIQGIGLGLAVARGFCDALGAAISIEDTPGGGATVVVRIPIAAEHAAAQS